MRNLLVTEHVTLDKMWIGINSDHKEYQLYLSCNPNIVEGTGRAITRKQMEGLGLALYCDSKKFMGYWTNIGSNLIANPLDCDLVIVDHILVAIGIDSDNCYCHLQTGTVCSKAQLFDICKISKLSSMLTEIKFLSNKLNRLVTEYEELENSSFTP